MGHSLDGRQIGKKIPFSLLHGNKIWKDEKRSDYKPGFSDVKKKAPYKSDRMRPTTTMHLIWAKLLVFLFTLIILAKTSCFLELPFPL